MKNRALHQRTLDVAEGILYPREQDISAPDFICGQILPIRFENIATVEFLSSSTAVEVGLGRIVDFQKEVFANDFSQDHGLGTIVMQSQRRFKSHFLMTERLSL